MYGCSDCTRDLHNVFLCTTFRIWPAAPETRRIRGCRGAGVPEGIPGDCDAPSRSTSLQGCVLRQCHVHLVVHMALCSTHTRAICRAAAGYPNMYMQSNGTLCICMACQLQPGRYVCTASTNAHNATRPTRVCCVHVATHIPSHHPAALPCVCLC